MSRVKEIRELMAQDRLLRAIEIPFKNKIIREKNRYIKQAAQYAVRHKSTSDSEYFEHRSNMREILEFYYRRTIRVFSRHIERTIDEKSTKLIIERKALWEELFLAFVSEYGAAKAEQTAFTTRADIQNAITASLAQPEGVVEEEFVKSILRTRGLSAYRADTIARTEAHGAAMYSSRETAREIIIETGVERKKQWIPALDERTRTSHANMIGSEPIGIDDYFIVGGEPMLNPADPNGSASNVINCRCVMIYVTDD